MKKNFLLLLPLLLLIILVYLYLQKTTVGQKTISNLVENEESFSCEYSIINPGVFTTEGVIKGESGQFLIKASSTNPVPGGYPNVMNILLTNEATYDWVYLDGVGKGYYTDSKRMQILNEIYQNLETPSVEYEDLEVLYSCAETTHPQNIFIKPGDVDFVYKKDLRI